MKRLNRWLMTAGMAAAMCFGAASLMAQNDTGNRPDNGPGPGPGGGNGRGFRGMDPAQMIQMRLDQLKTELEVTDEAEWKELQTRLTKVMEAERAVMGDRMRGLMGNRNRRGNDQGGDQGGQRRGGPGGMFQASAEAEALQKAIDAKATKDEIKAALDKYTAARKVRQTALEDAQENLRKLTTTRQKAILTLGGLL